MNKYFLISFLALAVSCTVVDDKPQAYPGYVRKPLSSSITHVQPMTGIVLWTDSDNVKKGDIQLEFSYMLYSDVCKEKDVFDWSVVDRLLDQVASRGHQAVLRFRYTYVGKKCAVPDYIKALPDYEETVGKSEGRTTYFPDWRCTELQRFHKEFYRLFAERYDQDPRIAFIETGFGLWAEYHIYDGPFKLGRTFPSKEFQKEFTLAMKEWFIHTPWLISIDAADRKYSPFSAEPELLDVPFGVFDDSFMCEEHDSYNRTNWLFFGKDRYAKAPAGGEFSYYEDYDQKHCLDADGIYGRTFEDEAAKYHLTFIIGNDQPRYQPWERINEASKAMGYRFQVKDFLVKKGSGAAVLVANGGVAPLYHDAFLDVDGVRSVINLRSLMPGDSLWVSIDNPSIGDSPVLSVACDRLVPGQEIEFEADVTAASK
ncbi:MAG: DUF4832 domain-containing protein [Bacteroidales bacterium]|nr:DUF4832 domain-containing protein [Bacteroidales bacterium]